MKSRNILKILFLSIVCILSYVFIISKKALWFYEYNNIIYLYLLPIILPINIYLLRKRNKFGIIFSIINGVLFVVEIINMIRGNLEFGGGAPCVEYLYLAIITYTLISNILNIRKESSLTNDLLLCIISFIIIVIHIRYYFDNSFLHNLLNITDTNNIVLQNSYSYVTSYYGYFMIMFVVVLINQEIYSIKTSDN